MTHHSRNVNLTRYKIYCYVLCCAMTTFKRNKYNLLNAHVIDSPNFLSCTCDADLDFVGKGRVMSSQCKERLKTTSLIIQHLRRHKLGYG